MFRLASRPCFARHRGVSKNSVALRSVVVLKLGADGVVGFILEGVSVDLGRTMLPVSPQIPFYHLLDDALNMMLVNASRVRNVPGRKTDPIRRRWGRRA
jgi:hypothetical protein